MIAVYDILARPLYDDERRIEYPALSCMNDDNIANRIRVEGAEPRIFAINASQKLNSDIAIDFRRVLAEKRISWKIDSLSEQIDNLSNSSDDHTELSEKLKCDRQYLIDLISD